eukprot:m.1220904 g.1220904  ORF g.1220904 m.1220904 type:complete len:390 (-) comp24623_c0_seq10:2224-3393(-)
MPACQMKDFSADHVAPMLPEVLASVLEWNGAGTQTSYGADDATTAMKERLCEVFETNVHVLLVPTGTGANSVALACISPPYGAIYCAGGAHIQTSECGAPELYSGSKLTLVPSHADGRVKIPAFKKIAEKPTKYPHEAKPSALSITQPTEAGFCYSLDEIKELCAIAHNYGLMVHMDGARFAHALVSPVLPAPTPAEMTWKLGVDVLCLGTTKSGTACCEAVVFFNQRQDLALAAGYFRKRGGLLLEKNRFLASQMLGYLGPRTQKSCADPTAPWLRGARHANEMAMLLATLVQTHCKHLGMSVVHDVQINMVFLEMPRSMHERLTSTGYKISLTAGSADAKGTPQSADYIRPRLCTHWYTERSDIHALVMAFFDAAGQPVPAELRGDV